jgi:hypothetical protein
MTTIGELSWRESTTGKEPREDTLWVCETPLGVFSVLRRDLGIDEPMHDTETGFRDIDRAWWLAQDGLDIRRHPDLTLEAATELIKEKATYNSTGRKAFGP